MAGKVDEVSQRGDDDPDGGEGDRGYLSEVMAEIAAEVERRRTSGDLPARAEAELQEIFLQFAPPSVREGPVPEALQAVDAAIYVNPVVPVGSNRSGGAIIKRGVRSVSLWYIGFVTQQVSQLGAAVSGYLHLVETRLARLERELQGGEGGAAPVLHVPSVHQPGAWWVAPARDALASSSGRVAHLAAGDGWLVSLLNSQGVDAYGVDPDASTDDLSRAGEGGPGRIDLRSGDPVTHLGKVGAAGLSGVVLTGVVETMAAQDRAVLLDRLDRVLGPGAVLVLHSLSYEWWGSDEVAPEADLARGRPLRPSSWRMLLDRRGYRTTILAQPGENERLNAVSDYLVIARKLGIS